MNSRLRETHPHLDIKKIWDTNNVSLSLLGQCEAYVNVIRDSPMLPDTHKELLRVSLIKGAIATTAIEGNTLTEEELEAILNEKSSLPPSREYQEREATNVINAFNQLIREVITDDIDEKINAALLKRFHRMIGVELGENFDAIPGRFREDQRVVGTYRCPDYRFVDELIKKFCVWQQREFHYPVDQTFSNTVIQAITSHVFLEWIHPFGDGNGRTGRLLEFYILLRGGNPTIASHILSNYYNQTRPLYYKHLNDARKNRNMTPFIEYALLGFRDGLAETVKTIQKSQFQIAWQKFIYDAFGSTRMRTHKVFKRRRRLMLDLPINETVHLEEIPELSMKLARRYAGLTLSTIRRDVNSLRDMELISLDNSWIKANSDSLRLTGHMPDRRQTLD